MPMFQSTPVIADERMADELPAAVEAVMFQSTPVIADERMIGMAMVLTLDRSFNPRPSLLTSECLGGLLIGHHLQVSIHARHC